VEMSFEPVKLFIGLVDFFSILLPGALLTYLLRADLVRSSWLRPVGRSGQRGRAGAPVQQLPDGPRHLPAGVIPRRGLPHY
jgi:hypothetical protein